MICRTRAAEQLKQELDSLNAEQEKAFSDAVFLGFHPQLVTEMDVRHTRIKALSDELYSFAGSTLKTQPLLPLSGHNLRRHSFPK
jgi:hypothetical protein